MIRSRCFGRPRETIRSGVNGALEDFAAAAGVGRRGGDVLNAVCTVLRGVDGTIDVTKAGSHLDVRGRKGGCIGAGKSCALLLFFGAGSGEGCACRRGARSDGQFQGLTSGQGGFGIHRSLLLGRRPLAHLWGCVPGTKRVGAARTNMRCVSNAVAKLP